MLTRSFDIADAEGMEALGARLAQLAPAGLIVHLSGELGAGKTTLVRGFLRGMGYTGSVRSPTYTLVEPYDFAERRVYHLDLYRLGDAEELEWIGLRDLLDGSSVALIEWPERGQGVLPPADLEIRIAYQGNGRLLTLIGQSPAGEQVAQQLDAEPN
ncbi:MAG: tRNA (adenosine(37)-N6)-threonylcarbamoyltransferase complex ATPase subunit type 1 TsaE [Gammaproteobacteria bacterium]|nr:tRNA (adenosine(37)-N6)-threonylcarbamoyltransferase complex ATPase subunit type 1 TsaE [Gammaproteobacteria bacterium]